MAEDLAHHLLTMTRKQLTLTIRTLVTRDLVHHRTHLLSGNTPYCEPLYLPLREARDKHRSG